MTLLTSRLRAECWGVRSGRWALAATASRRCFTCGARLGMRACKSSGGGWARTATWLVRCRRLRRSVRLVCDGRTVRWSMSALARVSASRRSMWHVPRRVHGVLRAPCARSVRLWQLLRRVPRSRRARPAASQLRTDVATVLLATTARRRRDGRRRLRLRLLRCRHRGTRDVSHAPRPRAPRARSRRSAWAARARTIPNLASARLLACARLVACARLTAAGARAAACVPASRRAGQRRLRSLLVSRRYCPLPSIQAPSYSLGAYRLAYKARGLPASYSLRA